MGTPPIEESDELLDELKQEAERQDLEIEEYIRQILKNRHRAEKLQGDIATLEQELESRQQRIEKLEKRLDSSQGGDSPPIGQSSGGSPPKERDGELDDQFDSQTSQSEGELRGKLSQQLERNEALEERIGELEEKVSSLRAERNKLQDRVEQLQSALESGGEVPKEELSGTGNDLTSEEALTQTNLFVRYKSRAKPTLEDLSGGDVDPQAVNENLSIEYHTQFDDDRAVIEGKDFESFLQGSRPFRFVSWLIRQLPYELIRSGKRSALKDVYAAIQDIDRIQFQGETEIETEDETEAEFRFGAVFRDGRGNPLILAEFNDERTPVYGDEMANLLDAAKVIADQEGKMGGAFYVTASFFESDALEIAETAESQSGLLSRSKKKSYVKTGRKSGFHLCLVEDRSNTMYLTMPEI